MKFAKFYAKRAGKVDFGAQIWWEIITIETGGL